MSSHDDKRFYRDLKRQIKKTGNKKARSFFKKQLDDNPEEAQWAEYDYGHDQSSSLNGRDGVNRKRNKLDHHENPTHSNEKREESQNSPENGRDN
jgi:hypothetical protein